MAYRGKYPNRVNTVSYSKQSGWYVRLNDGTIHRPEHRAVVLAFPVHGIECGMDWNECKLAMVRALSAPAKAAPGPDYRAAIAKQEADIAMGANIPETIKPAKPARHYYARGPVVLVRHANLQGRNIFFHDDCGTVEAAQVEAARLNAKERDSSNA